MNKEYTIVLNIV